MCVTHESFKYTNRQVIDITSFTGGGEQKTGQDIDEQALMDEYTKDQTPSHCCSGVRCGPLKRKREGDGVIICIQELNGCHDFLQAHRSKRYLRYHNCLGTQKRHNTHLWSIWSACLFVCRYCSHPSASLTFSFWLKPVMPYRQHQHRY